MRRQLREAFVTAHGNDCAQVTEIDNGSYLVEDCDIPLICKTFKLQVRITIDHNQRNAHDELTWDRVWGEAGEQLYVLEAFPMCLTSRSPPFTSYCRV